jgi:hypothetical protein
MLGSCFTVALKPNAAQTNGASNSLVRKPTPSHPIYTGILTGFLGSTLAVAQMRGIVAFVLVSLMLWYKLRMEEQWMRTQFGAPYCQERIQGEAVDGEENTKVNSLRPLQQWLRWTEIN